MWLINLTISLFSIIKTKALECVSVVNQKCMPRPKILDVNEGVGEVLFYPYNVLVNKCNGSCNTLDDPMAKMCVPNIIKRVNMKVYNFLMRLNETRNVLWHESFKCVCRLNSLVCNSKQIWNSDICKCDCNEDFAGIMNSDKEYMWNPSTCACECDMWCKPGQYLGYKKCVCKNKLIGKIISECTSIMNETMMNDKNNIANDDTTTSIFVGLFAVLLFIGITCFCIFAYILSGLKVKNYFKKNILIIKNYKMVSRHYYFKTKNYAPSRMIYLKDFKSSNLKITKINCADRFVHFIDYLKNDNTKALYLKMLDFYGYIEIINDERILKIVKTNLNDNFLNDFKKVLNNIINGINQFWYDCKHVFNDDYFKIIIDDINDHLIIPFDCLSKFDMAVISCRLATKKNDTLNIEFYLKQCPFNDNWFKH